METEKKIEPTPEDIAEAERMAMDYAFIALNWLNFDTSLESVKAQDAVEIAKQICESKSCKSSKSDLPSLLAAKRERDMAILDVKHWQAVCDHLINHCKVNECDECAKIICPHGEPLHTHHDGCPSCCQIDWVEQERDKLRAQVEALTAVIDKCCDFDANGKPVEKGSTLYLQPNDDATREPMTLKVEGTRKYCWFNTKEDALTALKKVMRYERD